MSDSWKDPRFAKDYMSNAENTDINWYEHFVNAPSLWSLIPNEVVTVLDFGCGPGEFTDQLKQKGYRTDGCDGSHAMVELAQSHFHGIDFFTWDGTSDFPIDKTYDAIVTKLTLHFINDLAALAVHIMPILNDNGYLLISVPHPISTMTKADGAYFEQIHYDTEIGAYGMSITMIHRSIQDYIRPFLDNGFALTSIDEPSIPRNISEKYKVTDDYARVPRRLNLRFKKVST